MSREDKYNVSISIAGAPPVPASEIEGEGWHIPAGAFDVTELDDDEFIDVILQEVTIKVDANGECKPYDAQGNEISVSVLGGAWDMTLYRVKPVE